MDEATEKDVGVAPDSAELKLETMVRGASGGRLFAKIAIAAGLLIGLSVAGYLGYDAYRKSQARVFPKQLREPRRSSDAVAALESRS